MLGKDNRPADRPSASCKPIFVFCSRTVTDVEAYKEAWTKYAENAQASTPGIRACFSFMDRDKQRTALQVFWFDGPESLPKDKPELMQDLQAQYAGTPETDYCQLFGGWNDEVKAAFSADPKVRVSVGKDSRGFIRDISWNGGKGFHAYKGPPMIWVSKRNIKPGRMEVIAKTFQKACDLQFYSAPAMLGSFEFTTEENPDKLWSLRFFNDYRKGYEGHFPLPSFIMWRVLFTVLPEFGGPFDFGYSFSCQKHIDDAIAENGGNKGYAQYIWGKDQLGPMPELAKGFKAASGP